MASDSTAETLTELIEKSNAIAGQRGALIRQVNDLFASIADHVEETREGRYGALVNFAARMQDARDAAREERDAALAELDEIKDSRDDLLQRINDAARDGAALGDSLVVADLVKALTNIIERPISNPLEAKIQGDVNHALVAFRKARKS